MSMARGRLEVLRALLHDGAEGDTSDSWRNMQENLQYENEHKRAMGWHAAPDSLLCDAGSQIPDAVHIRAESTYLPVPLPPSRTGRNPQHLPP